MGGEKNTSIDDYFDNQTAADLNQWVPETLQKTTTRPTKQHPTLTTSKDAISTNNCRSQACTYCR